MKLYLTVITLWVEIFCIGKNGFVTVNISVLLYGNFVDL